MSRTAYCYQYIGSIRLGSIIEAHAYNLVAVDFEYAKLIVYYTKLHFFRKMLGFEITVLTT